MSNCTEIRLREIPENFPEKYIEPDGHVYLALDLGFKYTETKRLERLLLTGNIQFDTSSGAIFKTTPKIDAVVDCFLDPNTIGQTYQDIPIDFVQGGHVVSDYCLRILTYNSKTVRALVLLDKFHWANLMQELTLCDLFEGETYVHNCPTVTDLGNSYIYDESSPHWYPTVDYGAFQWNNPVDYEPNLANPNRFLRRQTLCNSYRRPFIFTSDILRRLFCKINYQFKSEFSEKEFVKRLIEYHVRPDFGKDKKEELDVKIIPRLRYSSFGNEEKVIVDDAEEDLFGNYNSGYYCGNGKVKINIQLRLVFDPEIFDVEEHNVKLGLYTIAKGPNGEPMPGAPSFELHSQVFDSSSTNKEGIDENPIGFFEIEDLEVDNSECNLIYLKFKESRDAGFLGFEIDGTESFIEYTGVRKFFDTGREYSYEEVFDCKNMLDWFKGFVHLGELKLDTDVSNRCLLAEPPYSLTIEDETCNGFFLDERVDLSYIVVPKTISIEAPDRDNERYVRKQFKNSTDQFIKDKELEEEPFTFFIDRGEQYDNEDTKEVSNNCFEPTCNRVVTLAPDRQKITLPVMKSSNDIRCQSWSIAPRILCTYGSVIQNIPPVDPNKTYLKICDDYTTLLPTAYQFEEDQLIGAVSNDPLAALVIPNCNVTFEEIFDNDGNQLFSLSIFAKQWLLEELLEAQLTMDVKLNSFLFDCIDFRQLAEITYHGKPFVARIKEITDFNRCDDSLTKMSFRPLYQNISGLCNYIVGNPDGGDCQNFPAITCIKDGDCHIFMIGGSIQSVISNVTFYKKGDPNEQIPNTTPVSAELCGETEQYQVCAIVSFEGDCPDVTTAIKTVFPCSNSQPEIICQGFYKSENGYCVNAVIGGQIFDNYTIIEFLADGEDYTAGSDLCGLSIGQTVNFTAIIDFDDACDPIELELDCLIPTPPGSCDDNQASIGFEEDANGCCKPMIVEDCLVEQPENCLFWYACLPEGQQPTKEDEILYTGPEFLCCPDGHVLWVKAMLFFCGTCDPLCIEWTQAVKDGCCNFQNIECSNCIAEVTDPCEGYSYVWYSLPDQTDPSNEPPFTADFVRTNYAVLQLGTSANLLDDVDMWYAVIGRKDGCPDSINYYFHDAPNAGEDTILTL